jgi:hypothetical protein
LDLDAQFSDRGGGSGWFDEHGQINVLGRSGGQSFTTNGHLMFRNASQFGAILKGVRITKYGNLNAVEGKHYKLVVGGWYGL